MNYRQLYATVISFLVLFVLFNVANAQSKDRDNPTPLTSSEISGLIDSDTKGNAYYYSFVANQGEVAVTLSVESNPPTDTYASSQKTVSFALYDRNAEVLSSKTVSTSYAAGIGQAVGRVNITRRQTLVLKINVLPETFNQGTGKYRVRISGAVEFEKSGASTSITDKSDTSEELVDIFSAPEIRFPEKGVLLISSNTASLKVALPSVWYIKFFGYSTKQQKITELSYGKISLPKRGNAIIYMKDKESFISFDLSQISEIELFRD